MALRGIKVVELAGLAPAPFCGMILADFGARVIRVDRTTPVPTLDTLARGKESIAIDIKQTKGCEIIKSLCTSSDVVIEPFRAGVMEKLGLGPSVLQALNPRLVYARLTGYGQNGPLSRKAGHDINYLAQSGGLSTLGRKGHAPYAPINLMADFAGGGMTCAMGIILALLERTTSGKGQIVDCSMTEGAAYIGSWLWRARQMPGIWGKPRGENWLDGGAHFYNTYRTRDGRYMSVGAIEPLFYDQLLTGLGLTHEQAPHMTDFESSFELFQKVFVTRTQDEWTDVFKELDAVWRRTQRPCVCC